MKEIINIEVVINKLGSIKTPRLSSVKIIFRADYPTHRLVLLRLSKITVMMI